ncbi:MAG: hypothetical protein CMK46_04215 [Porticoccus sp.]|uniref:hypothetical protein n=1 Tax=Porticoccus hydrocarbonoclasticus TaxID=1073414 RepID=UPI000C409237|nr:hypothetical protein [Porticoccus hydrocarbonoclasticus]MBG57476.1 hypothetical protein [Porticoccus sp.]|tara:strand:- start:3358 stop:3993 length:636 start_codon:yes stop_codon:yes gene_type:complete
MSAQALIAKAEAQGITLRLQAGAIAWESHRLPPDELLAELAAHKSEIVFALAQANTLSPLSTDDNCIINAWLDLIGENDFAQRLFVLQRCAANPLALEYVLGLVADAGLVVIALDEPILRPAILSVPSIWEATEDLPLLPDDKQFLTDLLQGKTLADKSALLAGYRRQWHEASSGETQEDRRDSAGRSAANRWIRRVATRGKSAQGHPNGC